MAAARVPRPHASYRRWPLAEKLRLVELALRPGASARAIADEHGVHQNTVGVWRRQYRAGKLDAKGAKRRVGEERSASFVPVSVTSTPRKRPDAGVSNAVVEVVFASKATLRIETGALDTVLLSALVAELRR
jgi:transposase-like protein